MADERDTLVEFSVTPLGASTADGGVSATVSRCVKLIRESGLPNELHSMGSIVEGSLDECLDLLKSCIRETLKDAPRASVSVKMDVRPGHTGRMRSKVEAVERQLK